MRLRGWIFKIDPFHTGIGRKNECLNNRQSAFQSIMADSEEF
jgi:hypothetical protein